MSDKTLAQVKEEMAWRPHSCLGKNKLLWEDFEKIATILIEEKGIIEKALPRIQEFRKIGKSGVQIIRVELLKAAIHYPALSLKEYYDQGRPCKCYNNVRGTPKTSILE